MKGMGIWLVVLGVSVFCGLIMIAIAAGAVIPKVIDPVAGPVVCRNGVLEITQNTTSYRPGESDTWTTDTCVDPATGNQLDVSFQTTLAAGMIYSLILFGIIAIVIIWYDFWKKYIKKNSN
jgi:hypothetical protein